MHFYQGIRIIHICHLKGKSETNLETIAENHNAATKKTEKYIKLVQVFVLGLHLVGFSSRRGGSRGGCWEKLLEAPPATSWTYLWPRPC